MPNEKSRVKWKNASRWFLKIHKTIKAIVIVLSFPLEPNGKNLLLKILHTLVTGYREGKLVLMKSFLPVD